MYQLTVDGKTYIASKDGAARLLNVPKTYLNRRIRENVGEYEIRFFTGKLRQMKDDFVDISNTTLKPEIKEFCLERLTTSAKLKSLHSQKSFGFQKGEE